MRLARRPTRVRGCCGRLVPCADPPTRNPQVGSADRLLPPDWPPRRCLPGMVGQSQGFPTFPVRRLRFEPVRWAIAPARCAEVPGAGQRCGCTVAREVLPCGRGACTRAAIEPEGGRRACVPQGARVLSLGFACSRSVLRARRWCVWASMQRACLRACGT